MRWRRVGSMTAGPRVVLSLGGQRLDVGAMSVERRGAFRALAREAETTMGLYPQSYSLFNACGQVDSPEALRRALENAGNGVCELEVRERPEWKWKKLREMDAQVKALENQGPAIDAAMKDMENRVLARVEIELEKMRGDFLRTDAKVCQGLAPLLHSVASEQIDLKAKVEDSIVPMVQSIATEQLHLQTRIDKSLVPVMERLAMEQIDAKAKLKTIDMDALIGCMESVAAKAREALETAVEQASFTRQETSSRGVESLVHSDVLTLAELVADKEKVLRREMQAISERTRSAQDDLKAVQSELNTIRQNQPSSTRTRPHPDALSESLTRASGGRREEDSRAPWAAEWTPDYLPASLPYSSKPAADVSMSRLGRRSRIGAGDAPLWTIPSEGTTAPFARQGARLGQRCQSSALAVGMAKVGSSIGVRGMNADACQLVRPLCLEG